MKHWKFAAIVGLLSVLACSSDPSREAPLELVQSIGAAGTSFVCPGADGFYCDGDQLDACAGGTIKKSAVCSSGCLPGSRAGDDRCANDPCDGLTGGSYCVPEERAVYSCSAGRTSDRKTCPLGCSAGAPAGHDDCLSCDPGQILCGGACLLGSSDIHNCGSCGNICHDGAQGTAACHLGRCGLDCRTGFADCDGVLDNGCEAALSSDSRNCGACGAICPGGQVCTAGHCGAPPDLYVTATSGADTNPGTPVAPLRTWKKAVAIAMPGVKISIAPGTYSLETGEDFSGSVPEGVTVQRWGSSGTVLFKDNDGQRAALSFAGSGAAYNLTLDGFYAAIYAASGTQTLDGITILNQASESDVRGTAQMSLSNFSLSGGRASGGGLLIRVSTNAKLALKNGTVSGTFGDCRTQSDGVVTLDTAQLAVSNVTFQQRFITPINVSDFSTATIEGSTFTSTCPGWMSVIVGPTATATLNHDNITGGVDAMGTVNINGGTIAGAGGTDAIVCQGAPHLTVRNATIKNGMMGIFIEAPGTYDFGTRQSPGGNVFAGNLNAAVHLNATGIRVDASGNHWLPNKQFADGAGTYPVGIAFAGPMGGTNPPENVYIFDSGSSVFF